MSPERACLASQLGLHSNDPCLPLLDDMLRCLPLSWTAAFDGQEKHWCVAGMHTGTSIEEESLSERSE